MATLTPELVRTPSARPDGQQPLVLLVEDNDAVREACGLMCERSGFKVAHAADAPEALELARELRPEAIVLDLMLPSMPGWDVARKLRADDRTSHIPILATSGLIAADAEPKARAAGADRYMAKPFDGRTLVHHLRQLLDA